MVVTAADSAIRCYECKQTPVIKDKALTAPRWRSNCSTLSEGRGQRHSVCVLGGLSVHLSTCTIIRHGCRLSLQPITPPSCTICTQASAQSTWLPSELRQSELVSRCTLVNIGVRFPGRNYTMLNDKQILHNARQGYQTCDLILWSCAFKCGSCNWCQHG